MDKLHEVSENKERIVIGVLSGTSVDSVDAVLVRIKGSGTESEIKVIDFLSHPIKDEIKSFILKCSSLGTGNVEDVCILNSLIARIFSVTVNKLIEKNGLRSADVDLIGSHGQTIYHMPQADDYFGFNFRTTLQVGDPSVIANLTGITTVGDFRISDTAAGGSGAPLVPYLDYVLFGNKPGDVILINIGGISNLTYLKKYCGMNEISAFDSGPGNMLIDGLMKKLFGKNFDEDGNTGFKGRVNQELLGKISEYDKFIKIPPPKSTGREHYGDEFLGYVLKNAGELCNEDIISTVTDYTAYSIFHNVKNFLETEKPEMYISGGGSKNKFLMECFNKYFPGLKIKEFETGGINYENKEAVLFALLANETVNGVPANVLNATGATRNVILGKICPVV